MGIEEGASFMIQEEVIVMTPGFAVEGEKTR